MLTLARRETVLTGLSTMARASSQHHEQKVLAARAQENERRVTAVRLVAIGLMALSQGLIRDLSGSPNSPDVVRGVAIGLYVVLAVMSFVAVRRVVPTFRRVRVMPLVATTVDVAFVVTMDLVDIRHGEVELAGSAAMLMLIISYSLLRYSAWSLAYAAALAIGAFTLAMVRAGQFTWPHWSFVVFAFVAATTLMLFTRTAVRRAFVELQRRESLSRLVAPKVVDEILAGRESGLRPARREVTVLFADLRDFTSYSEARAPEEVLRFLDDYFGRMTLVVQGHEGSVNKFLGDGLMALWGAPTPLADHAVHAVKAAHDMQRVMLEINAQRAADGEAPLHVGIGVHTGEVAAGMLGGTNQAEYSVIGDAVNVASRIEGLTREHGAQILVSDATWQALGGRFAGERVGEVTVKGRRATVVIHALTPRDGAARADAAASE